MNTSRRPDFSRVLILNIFCTAAATTTAAATQGVPAQNAGIFICILMILCNEAWYRMAALPSLIIAAVDFFRKSSDKKAEKHTRLALRLSACVLLLVPHFIFGILFLANSFTQGKIAEEIAIPISHGVFASTFLAPALLWFIAQLGTVFPLSFEQLFAQDELIHTPEGDKSPHPHTPAAESAPIHPQLRAQAGELLYYSRPDQNATHVHAGTRAIIGYCLLPLVLLMAAIAMGSYKESALFAAVAGALALVFGMVCYKLINEPAAWQRKLSRVEYAFNSTHAYIAEGHHIQTFNIDDSLNIQHEMNKDGSGNIYLSQSGKTGKTIRKLLGDKLEINDSTSHYNLSAPLCGFFCIRDSAQVSKQLMQQRRANTH